MKLEQMERLQTSATIAPARERPAPPDLGELYGGRLGHFAKRCIDLGGAALGLALLAPILAFVAVAIRLESKGPALFIQHRIGLNGRPFRIFKFRTMVVDAERRLADLEHRNESKGGVLFKIKDDPRVTRLGRLLRATSLDELPQLINVLQGSMSLVGPRPLPVRDCEILQARDNRLYLERHGVLPGLTGPWQVGGRSETGIEEMLVYDINYVNQWSFFLDLKIILKTFSVLLERRGAY